MNDIYAELHRRLSDALGIPVAGWRDLAGWTGLDKLSSPLLFLLEAGLIGLVLVWITRTRSPAFRAIKGDLMSRTRPARVVGYLSVVFLVGSFGVWSSAAVLASAIVAPGVISPEGYRKTVQHLEGGIIDTINVQEGDKVTAGQVLINLKTIGAQGHFDELHERYVRLLAIEARLVAELAGKDRVTFPNELTALGSKVAENVAASEQELLRSRIESRDGRERILHQRVRQIEEQISGLRQVIAAQDEQLALIDREIKMSQGLFEKGLESLPRLLALQRGRSDIRASQAENRASVARSGQQIGETDLQLLNLRQQDREKASEDLAKVRGDLAELRSQLPARQDALTRTAVVAPISGTVMHLRVTTESGVISAGQPILDIVPNAPNLIIDSRIKPSDIDMLHPEMAARVVLSAYPMRHLPQIHGQLISVSADRLTDEHTGEPYFLGRVKVDTAELEKLHEIRLTPGMPAEVMIMTGEHTLLDYALAPIRDSLNRGFREN